MQPGVDWNRTASAPEVLFNEVICRSVRGADAPMPAPVRSAFVFPHLPKGAD